jgi:hypothetical protein
VRDVPAVRDCVVKAVVNVGAVFITIAFEVGVTTSVIVRELSDVPAESSRVPVT